MMAYDQWSMVIDQLKIGTVKKRIFWVAPAVEANYYGDQESRHGWEGLFISDWIFYSIISFNDFSCTKLW